MNLLFATVKLRRLNHLPRARFPHSTRPSPDSDSVNSSGAGIRATQLLNLAATECRPAGPSAGQKCKWIIYLQRWSAKGLADLL
jgi:hypothetical protein